MSAITRALHALRSMDDAFSPSDFDDGINTSNPDPGSQFDPSNFEDWNVDDDDPDSDSDDDDDGPDFGYCPLCGDQHDDPDSGDCPDDDLTVYASAGPAGFEYRPYVGPGGL
jgi:hypothetical protein